MCNIMLITAATCWSKQILDVYLYLPHKSHFWENQCRRCVMFVQQPLSTLDVVFCFHQLIYKLFSFFLFVFFGFQRLFAHSTKHSLCVHQTHIISLTQNTTHQVHGSVYCHSHVKDMKEQNSLAAYRLTYSQNCRGKSVQFVKKKKKAFELYFIITFIIVATYYINNNYNNYYYCCYCC